jgi:hypothetical protein
MTEKGFLWLAGLGIPNLDEAGWIIAARGDVFSIRREGRRVDVLALML